MKNLKSKIKASLIILSICTLLFGIGFLKFKIWRAEHPHAKTWTFFVPSKK